MYTDTQLDLWEIFIQSRPGTNHTHAGSVHVSDKQMALQNARDIYTRRNEGSRIWIIPSKYVTASNPEDAAILFDPASDKIYRHPALYAMT